MPRALPQLSAGSKVTALQGQEHPDLHRKPGINKVHPTSSVLTPPIFLVAAGTSPLSLCHGDTAREKATTALPTFIPTHPFQEPESQEKWGRKKEKKKGNKSKSIYEAWPLTLAQAFPACDYLQTLFLLLLFLLQACISPWGCRAGCWSLHTARLQLLGISLMMMIKIPFNLHPALQ